MRFITGLLITGVMLCASDFQVVFETTTCNGEKGFATAKMEDVYKIESASCLDPADSKSKLQQVLVKNSRGSYDTFTLTQSEAKDVVAQMKSYTKARLKNLENANTLIISK